MVFEAYEQHIKKRWIEPSRLLKFLIFLQKLFVWTHEPQTGDFRGCGPSSDVLNQNPQIDHTTAKLLGTSLKESERF